MVQARPVRGDEHVRGEQVAVVAAHFAKAQRTDLLAHLDEDLGVEAEAAPRVQHRLQGGDVDGVLALVVGGAAAVPAIAPFGQAPRRQAFEPLVVLAAGDVAVAVGEYRGKAVRFVAFGKEEGACRRHRVLQDAAAETEFLQTRLHLVDHVGPEGIGPGRRLAFSGDGDAAFQVIEETAIVEIGGCGGDGVGSAHSCCPPVIGEFPDAQ